MNVPERHTALGRAARAFESLGISYAVGGSLASAFYGIPRSTNDVDIVADIGSADVSSLAAALEPDFYLDAIAMRAAVTDRQSFNVLFRDDFTKVDVFLVSDGSWGRLQLARARRERLAPDAGAEPVLVASAEDTVLAKLVWFEKGNRVSDRQWQDVRDVLQIQGTALDTTYLRTWAADLGIGELLEQAMAQAGLARQ